jgi:hypothetical protein
MIEAGHRQRLRDLAVQSVESRDPPAEYEGLHWSAFHARLDRLTPATPSAHARPEIASAPAREARQNRRAAGFGADGAEPIVVLSARQSTFRTDAAPAELRRGLSRRSGGQLSSLTLGDQAARHGIGSRLRAAVCRHRRRIARRGLPIVVCQLVNAPAVLGARGVDQPVSRCKVAVRPNRARVGTQPARWWGASQRA